MPNIMIMNQMVLTEGLFDMLSTLKRAFANFATNVTKKGLTISAEEYELEGIYQEILNKAAEKGFRQRRPEMENKFEFVSGTEIFTVSKPKAQRHTVRIELVFN